MIHRIGFLAFLFLITTAAFGQVGGLAGAVTDATTGRELVGVTLTLKPGNKEDITDVEGRFLYSNLQPGIYALELREVNHKTTIIPILRVSANEITVVRLSMYDSVKALSGIIITAKKPRAENIAGIALERKSSPNIMDGISQESIKRTPDRSSAEAMRRISGITILDNKYPVVRGLSDRYNMALLNGIPMPSTLPDRKTFAFDAIPASLLDNMLVVKTAMPDQPGEFAGAIILLNTRDIPDESVQTISFGLGGYGNSIGRNGSWQTNKAPDLLGLGSWGRQWPTGMPQTADFKKFQINEKIELSKKFENDWGLKQSVIIPGIQFQYSNSTRFRFAKKEAGSLLAFSYSRLSRINNIDRKEYNNNGITRDYTEEQSADNVLLGAMLNFSVKLNKKNKITLRNFLNNNATEENNIRQGTNLESGTFQKAYSMNYLQNYLVGMQLAGDHFMPKSGIKFKWDGGIQRVMRNTPDYRRLLYTRLADSPGDPLVAAVSPQSNFGNAGKMFITLTENIKFASYNFSKTYYNDNFKSELKFGGFHQFKNRQFSTRIFTVVENPSVDEKLKELNPSQIFDPSNMSFTGFRYDEIPDDGSYNYAGKQNLNAGYLMTDNIFNRIFRITGGVRIEHFYQQMVTKNKQNITITPTLNNLNILPSVAITYMATNRTNLRLAYSQTVSRPDFREISPFSYFDFVNFVSIEGNEKLKSAQIQNFDFRFETYPGDGQSFSVGAFYKKFTNPIEQIVNPVVADGNRSIRFANAYAANVYGAELEFRMKLKKFVRALKNWEFSGNLTYIKSEVQFSKDSANQTKRALQGQSPYIANFGLYYNGRSSGWSVAINYNLVGPRIYSVGTINYPNFYDKNRNVLDLQIAKSLSNRSEIKFSVADVIAQDFILYQNTDLNAAYSTSDRVVNRMKTAPLFLMNFIFRLK